MDSIGERWWLQIKHLGDIQKINGATIPKVDIITFGAPCQDLSVAGKRKGMLHESMGDEETTRSGLFYEAIRVVKEMRSDDIRNGRTGQFIRPRYTVYENVPGAFSSNHGEDFRAVLEETVRVVEPDAVIPEPPKEGWHKSGAIVGNGWSIAWRIHDAQYFGVPQRRKRLCLLADFNGSTAPDILFDAQLLRDAEDPESDTPIGYFRGECGFKISSVEESLSGDSEQGGSEEQGTAEGTEGSARISSFQERSGKPGGARDSFNNMTEQEQSQPSTIRAYGISPYDSEGMKSANPKAGYYEADTSRTLDITGGNPACNQGGGISG